MKPFYKNRDNSLRRNSTAGSHIASENARELVCVRLLLQVLHVFSCLSDNLCQLITVWWRAVRLPVPRSHLLAAMTVTQPRSPALERWGYKLRLSQAVEDEHKISRAIFTRLIKRWWWAVYVPLVCFLALPKGRLGGIEDIVVYHIFQQWLSVPEDLQIQQKLQISSSKAEQILSVVHMC